MSDSVIYSQPAYLLHQQHYRETSLIADVLTRDYGRISIIAKGVRRTKSKTLGMLRPYKLLSISYQGKTGLKTLTQVEPVGLTGELTGMNLYYGFYVNELVCFFLHKDDPHPEVFRDYEACITELAYSAFVEPALRNFEINLMENIGYGINFELDLKNEKPIEPTKKYLFNNEEGLIEDAQGIFSGASLLAMEQRYFQHPTTLKEAKTLMRMVIDSRLQGKRLNSRTVVNTLVKRM